MKVLIADDDKIIRRDLKKLIDWNANGFELTAEASNGKEALELIKSHHIEIVITDIYMPVMNGVELIKSIKETFKEIQIIVMSNYDDFIYVKDAMKFGALDYVLKYQLEEGSLISLLNSAAKEVERLREENSERQERNKAVIQEREQLSKEFWKDFLEGKFSQEHAYKRIKELKIELPQGDFMVILIQTSDQLELHGRELDSIIHDNLYKWIDAGDEERLLLIHFKERSFLHIYNKIYEIMKKLFDNIKSSKIVMVNSPASIFLAGLPDEVAKLRESMRSYFYQGQDRFLIREEKIQFKTQFDDSIIEKKENKVLDALKTGEKEEFESALKEMFREIREQKYHPDIVISELKLVIQHIVKAVRNYENCKNDVLPQLDSLMFQMNDRFVTLNDIEESLGSILKKYFQYHKQDTCKSSRCEIDVAVKYIHKNYKNAITLNELAEYVGLSKNHFCMLFKQETGENFTDYVNRLRINEAKSLIKEKAYRINEAAFEVGISNQRYFCKLFKHYTGVNPKEYKNRRLVL